MATTEQDLKYRIEYADARGRILVGNSLTSFENTDHRRDVTVGASFAGIPTGVLPVRQGAKGWIAHEGGPGLDEAGIGGLPLADEYGVPAAAIATHTARLSDGDSLLIGVVSRANKAAWALGVRPHQTGLEAAMLMLDAPDGAFRNVDGRVDESTTTLEQGTDGAILACWSFSRVDGQHPHDVFLVASHGAKIMALYALRVHPKGMICNDAGRGLDDSGVEGIWELDTHSIPAATVSTDSARIGDPLSTWHGQVSEANMAARRLGIAVGDSAQQAARTMLAAP